MPSAKQALKFCELVAVDAMIIATKGAKYGLSFTSGFTKLLFGGAQNLTNQFASGTNFGIGKYLYASGEKVVNKGFDLLISLQKSVQKALR